MSHRRLWVVGLLAVATLILRPAPMAAASALPFTAIAPGSGATCALTSAGGVKCWGYNHFGELGNGTTTTALTPVDVQGLAGGVRMIAARDERNCAVTAAGEVMCWGLNETSHVGSSRPTSTLVPVEMEGLAGVTAVALGSGHTCVLTSAAGVKCWGYNSSGQLGNGSTTGSNLPVDVSGLAAGVRAISAGSQHTCALTNAGGVKCWGANNVGQLGIGSPASAGVPTDVTGLTSGVVAIAAGYVHTCALTSRGGVKCWGYNGSGRLGNGITTGSTRFPAEVTGLDRGVVAITAGGAHTCALTSSGGATCWGYNRSGQLGNGSTSNRVVPASVSGLARGVVAIAAGNEHTCALLGETAKCWGYNRYGQLGDGTRTNRKVPVDVDVRVHPTIALQSSVPSGTIPRGTAVTFTASVDPLAPDGGAAVVRFVVYRRDDGGPWRTDASRDVRTDSTGQARLRWTFVTAGERYVRAKVVANADYAASGWSVKVAYTVR